jgi:hypothetical protein
LRSPEVQQLTVTLEQLERQLQQLRTQINAAQPPSGETSKDKPANRGNIASANQAVALEGEIKEEKGKLESYGFIMPDSGYESSIPTDLGDLKTQFEFELFGAGVDASHTTF